MNTKNKTDNTNKQGVDWLKVLQVLWNNKKTLLITIIVFISVGIASSILGPKEYKSKSMVLIENSSTLGALSGLLGQLSSLPISGMNIDSKTKEALIPDLYPDVITSNSFLRELVNNKVVESKYDSTITINNYLKYHTRTNIIWDYTLGLPGKFLGLFKKRRQDTVINEKIPITDTNLVPVRLSSDQFEIIEDIKSRISTSQEFKKNNKIEITVVMQDPGVAAQVNSYIIKSLDQYVTMYRTRKAQQDLDFITARYDDAKEKYVDAQQELATYRDRNKNVILSTVKSEEDRLEAEYNLAYDLYNTLSQQMENAKIRVQENKPVVIVIDPPNIPLKKDKPKTILTIILMTFLGIIVGAGIIYLPIFLKELKLFLTRIKAGSGTV